MSFAGCGGKTPALSSSSVPALASLVVQRVHSPLERTVDGTIEAVNQATVSSQTAGRITEILYDVNDVVPAGAVIIRLRGSEQRAGLQSAQAALTEAKARDAEAATTYQRISELFQRHVVSKAQLDQATANRDAAAARLTAAEAGIATAREGVGYTEIRAPYGGVVTKRLVEVGESVSPGTPLMSGLSLQDLRVDTNVPQSIVMEVRRRKQAAVYLGNRRIEATKITIFPEAATPSSTFRARLDLPPGALDLAPGMYVKVGLVVGDADRLLIPASAVVERSEVTGVYVLDSHGRATLRYVRPGQHVGDQIEILAGLESGERIALDPIAASTAAGPAS
ncbi:MAG TPA: efflux RND transporter periplasmic adaptor subunit [Steroidobacteraceae bacterium]|nr:efflux RND transporter periplasmic adaptor subunit [Steroidobacteraceae bacterium]